MTKLCEASEKPFKSAQVDDDIPHVSIKTSVLMDQSPYLKNLLTNGHREPIDFQISMDEKPDWLEPEKFKRGQKFGKENLFSVSSSKFLAIFMVWALQPVILPFVFSGTVTTPFKVFKLYVSTFFKISTWYDHDVWSEKSNIGRMILMKARSSHKDLHLKIQASKSKGIKEKISLEAETNPSFNYLAQNISKNIESSCPFSLRSADSKLGVNQMNMAMIQFVCAGLSVTYPQTFGIHYATEDDFEGYVHFWRGIGYLVGIKDEYNFCNGDLNEVRKRTKDFMEFVLKPAFTNFSNEWENILRTLTDSVRYYTSKLQFETCLLYTLEILGIDLADLRHRSSYFQVFCFYMLKFFFGFLMKVPYFSSFVNKAFFSTMKKLMEKEMEISKKNSQQGFPIQPKSYVKEK